MARVLFVVAVITVLSAATSLVDATPTTRSPHYAVALYAPAPEIPAEARAKHLAGNGLCILYVRPDGTVSHVDMAQSTGQPLLDAASIQAFSRWRFRPNSIIIRRDGSRRVRIPISYTGNYEKPPKT
jgi:TonB family protein